MEGKLLGPIDLERKEGLEQFHRSGAVLGFDLLSFWQWTLSDVITNTNRGVLAEYLVAQALGTVGISVREAWAPFDLTAADGITVEVKSSAFIQSWYQNKYTPISFSVAKKKAWNKDTNIQDQKKARQADVYVFALLSHKDQGTLDPLNVDQWEFFVLPTSVLDNRERSQHSITLPSLRQLHGNPVCFSDLREAVAKAGRSQAKNRRKTKPDGR